MAQKKFTQLTVATAVDGTEVIAIVQASTSKQLTLSILQDKVNHWRGAWNASDDAFPTTGGTGMAGAVSAGDEWYISVSGEPNGFLLQVNALIKAKIDTPGQTQDNWIITNN